MKHPSCFFLIVTEIILIQKIFESNFDFNIFFFQNWFFFSI